MRTSKIFVLASLFFLFACATFPDRKTVQEEDSCTPSKTEDSSDLVFKVSPEVADKMMRLQLEHMEQIRKENKEKKNQ